MEIVKKDENCKTIIDPEMIWNDLDPELHGSLMPVDRIICRHLLLYGDTRYDVEILYKVISPEHSDLVDQFTNSSYENILLSIMRAKPINPFVSAHDDHYICAIMRVIEEDRIIRVFNLGIYKYKEGIDKFKKGIKRQIRVVNDHKVFKQWLKADSDEQIYSISIDSDKLKRQTIHILNNLGDISDAAISFDCNCDNKDIAKASITLKTYGKKNDISVILTLQTNLIGDCMTIGEISCDKFRKIGTEHGFKNLFKYFDSIYVKYDNNLYKIGEERVM